MDSKTPDDMAELIKIHMHQRYPRECYAVEWKEVNIVLFDSHLGGCVSTLTSTEINTSEDEISHWLKCHEYLKSSLSRLDDLIEILDGNCKDYYVNWKIIVEYLLSSVPYLPPYVEIPHS